MDNQIPNSPIDPENNIDPNQTDDSADFLDYALESSSFEQSSETNLPSNDEELASLFDDDEPLKMPEQIVEHFVDGKPVRKSMRLKPILAVALPLLLLVFLFANGTISKIAKSIFSSSTIKKTVYQQQLEKGRKIFIETDNLADYAPNLRPENIVAGLDFELYDAGRKIAPSRYQITTTPASLNLVILLDLSIADKNMLQIKRKRLDHILSYLTKMEVVKEHKRIHKKYWLFSYNRNNRTTRWFQNASSLPIERVTKNINFILPGTNRDLLLMRTLKQLARKKNKNFQLIYISDYAITKSSRFNSERLYNFLKKHHNFQIYNLKIERRAKLLNADPFYYLSNNTQDFKRASWAFGYYSIFAPNIREQLNRVHASLNKAVPVKKIEITYHPDRSSLGVTDENQTRLRGITLLLRRNPFDLTLSQLNKQFHNPVGYRFVLPSQPKQEKIKPFITKEQHIIAKQQIVFKIKNGCNDYQKNADKIANFFKARIEVSRKEGIFLATLTSSNQQFPSQLKKFRAQKALHKNLSFIAPNIIFLRECMTEKNVAAGWHHQFFSKKSLPTIENKLNLYLFLAGQKFPNNSALQEHATMPLYSSTQKKVTPDYSQLIADLLSHRWPIQYQATTLLGSAPIQLTYDGKKRYATTGFEILSALAEITSRTQKKERAILYIDNNGFLPASWKIAQIGIKTYLQSQLDTLKEQQVAIVAPLPSEKLLLKTTANIFFAASAAPGSPFPSIVTPYNNSAAQWFLLPGKNIAHNENCAGGNAIAAASLVPAISLILSKAPNFEWHQIAEVLSSSGELRGELTSDRSVNNRGIITTRMLNAVVNNRLKQAKNIIKFHDFKKNAYRQANSILQSDLNRNSAPAQIYPIPEGLTKQFKRTYQFYDRGAAFTKEQKNSALYDLSSPFQLTQKERNELAIVAHNGTIFLMCTRNGQRGWIINLESQLPLNSNRCPTLLQFDKSDQLFFTMTGYGEVIAADIYSGLLQKFVIRHNKKSIRIGSALITDHALGSAFLCVDSKHNQLWIYGSGSRYPVMLKYTRSGNTITLEYDKKKGINQLQLFSKPLPPTTDACSLFSPPVIFSTGSINFIRRAIPENPKTVYYKFSKDGTRF